MGKINRISLNKISNGILDVFKNTPADVNTVNQLVDRLNSITDTDGQISSSVSTSLYKIYSALLTQSGTAAPVVTVLENTIGTIVWTRSSGGIYVATLTSAFTDSKTQLFYGTGIGFTLCQFFRTSGDETNSLTLISFDDSITPTDNSLLNTSIQIKVYN